MPVVEPVRQPGPAPAAAGTPHPRVLVLGNHGFNQVTGTGVTLSNLFQGWPVDRLFAVHTDAVPTAHDVCALEHRLGPDEVRKPGAWLAGCGRGRALPVVAIGRGDGASHPAAPPAPGGGGMGGRLKARLLGSDEVPQRIVPGRALLERLDAFAPDVIYCLPGPNAMLALIDRLRRRFRIPHVFHVMDDWKTDKYGRGLLNGPRRRLFRHRFAALATGAAARLAICPAMARAYAAEFGVPFEAFQNTIDSARWGPLARTDATVGAEFRVLYMGSLYPFAQADSLVDLCRVVAGLRAAGRPVHCDIHSPAFMAAAYRERLACDPAIRVHDPIPDRDAFFRRLCAADLLLLPVNFDPVSVAFIRYSMPAKVPEYLLSGVPILVYGPRGVAQVDYALEEGWGHVVDVRDPQRLTAALDRLANDHGLRQALSARARAVARAHHDATAVRARFQAVITAAARRPGRAEAVP